jgi:hypothetical protein
MKNKVSLGFAFIVFFLLSFFNGSATTISSRAGSGNWTDTAHWTPAQVPTSADSVIITSGNPITIQSAVTAYCKGLNVKSGATLTHTGILHNGGNYKQDGTCTGGGALFFDGTNGHINGSATINSACVYVFTGSTYIDAGTTIYAISAYMEIVGAITVTNNGSVTTSNGTFGIIFLTTSLTYGGGGTWVQGANSYLFPGQGFYPVTGASGYLDASASGNTVEYGYFCATIFPSSAGYYHIKISGSCFPTLISNIAVAGNFTITSGGMTTNTYTITLTGNWFNYGSGTTNAGQPKMIFNGTSAQSIYRAGTEYFNNTTLSGTNTVSLSFGLEVSDFVIGSGATFDMNTSALFEVFGNWTNYGTFYPRTSVTYLCPYSGYTDTLYNSHGIENFYNLGKLNPGTTALRSNINVTGTTSMSGVLGLYIFSGAGTIDAGTRPDTIFLTSNWTNYATFVPRNSTVITKGSGSIAKYIGSSVGTETFNNLNCTGSSYNTIFATPVSCAGNLLINNSYAVQNGGANLTVTGNLNINSGSTLYGYAQSITLGGNWTNSGSYSSTSASHLIVDGSGSQTIYNSTSGGFYNMAVNKGSGTLTMGCPLSVVDSLRLIKGAVVTTSTNLLTLLSGLQLYGGSDTAYISGPLAKYGNTAFTFPLGSTSLSTGAYHPLSITAPSSTTDEFVAQYYPTGQTYGSTADDSIQSVSTSEYWTLNRSVGSSTPQITLGWNSNNSLDDSYYDYRVTAWDGTAWRNKGNAAFTSSGSKGTIKTATAVAYSPNPQPITISKIKFYAPFAVLRRKLDGGYTTINSHGILAFIYPEEYNDTDSKLTYNLYDKNNTVIASNATALSGYVPVVNYGDNRYGLNLLSASLGLSSAITHGNNYVLEVINEKNEKWYLRARY